MARLGLGRKREEEEQARQAMSEQEAAVVEGRDYAKNTAAAMQATKHHVVAEHPTNPFEQTAKKTDAQIIADYDAEMAARDGMAPGNPKVDTGYNDISVDFSSIKSNEQAAYFASTLHDETTKAEFLKDWAKYSKQDSETVLSGAEDLLGTRLFAQPVSETGKNKAKEAAIAKTRTDAMQELSGLNLMGFDGQSINVNTADPATVVRGINSIADDDLRAKGQKLYKTLTETPGSRFYGESTDGVGDFLESANLTKSEYREKTDDYQSLFYGDGAHKQEDAQNYLDARQEIEESEYSAYAKAQLTAALDKAYQGITGTATPSASADDTAIEADDREQETEEGEKRGFLAKAGDGLSQFVSGLFGKTPDDAAQTDKEKRGEALHEAQAAYYDETPKEVQGPVQQKEMTPEEKIISQGGMSFEEWKTATPSVSSADNLRRFASSESATGGDDAGKSLKEGGDACTDEADAEIQKMEAQTVGEAAGALLSGEYDSIEGAGKDELDRMLEGSAYARRMIGTLTEEDSRRVLVGNDMAEMVTYGSIAAQGQKIKTLYDAMQSDSFPAELRGDVLAQMVAWASQAEKMEQAGTLGGDTELPLMERLLTTDEQAMDELESIYAARDELLADKAEMRRAREEENAQALSDAREAALNGTASEEQLTLVRENAQVDQDELNADMGYVGRLAAVDDYFRPGAGENAVSPFEAGSVKLNLDAQGVTDTAAYESALNGQMGVLLEEDAQTAHALGLTLDEYYQKTGGLDMDALCERAASRISRQGASITEEEMTALEAPFGQGVGAGYTLGAGIRAGGEQWYLDFKDSLYVGYSQVMVTRNASRIQNRYQNEYGAYGRTQYKKDIQAALDSGTLDENYAEALKKALASAADVYQLGIDPLDFEGDFLKNSAEARRDIATLKGYMRENATQDEYKWFGRVTSMTYNAVSAGVSTAATLLTGNNLAGFATGYSVVGFKNNFDEYLQKGYSINAAKQLAAVNTGIVCAANIGTTDKIIGQLTGMSTLSEAAKNVIVRNPAGACKGLAAIRAFGKAFIQNEFDEVVHDEFFEELGANWTDNALGEIYRKLDAGEEITFTDGLKLALNTLNPQNLDVKGAAEGVVSGAVENAIGAVMFSLSGATGAAVGSLRGVQAAHDLMSGKRDDVQQVIKEVTETLGDEQACALLDSYAEQQKESQATAEELVSGKDEHGSLSAARHAQADAQRHEGKAQEAARTMEATAQIIEEKQTAIENGEGDALAAQELSDAAMAYAKAKKDYAEQTAMAEHRKDDADTAIDRRVQDARQEARQAIRREQEAAREALSEDRQARAAGIDSELEALNAQDEALQNEFTEALSGLSDAQEMGMDEDTIAQLMARTDEIAERMAALEEARERLSNPEAYSTQEEAAQTEPTEQDTQTEQAAQNGQAAQSAQAELNVQIAPNAQDAQTMQAAQTEQIVQSAPQNAQTEETAQTAGSQYSVGTVGREAGQSGVDAGGLKNPVFQKFASVIYKNHGTEIVVANLMDGAKSAYDPRTNRLYISSKLGMGTAMREALVHELMHSVEGRGGYEAYKEAAMQAAYHGNRADMQHDIERIQEVYGAVYEREGRTLTETDVQKELVTRATEKVIEQLAGWTKTGGETQIYDLLGEKQRFGVRLYNQLTQFIARRKAKKSGTLEAYNELVRARDALKEALQGAKKTQADGGTQYAITLDESNWPMVKADRDFVLSDDPKQWGRQIRDYIRNEVRKHGEMRIKTLDGDEIILDAKSQGKAKDWLLSATDENNRVRKNASAHLDEVVEVSVDNDKNRPNVPDEKSKHVWSKDGWRYRNAVFEDYNGKRYLLELSVGVDGDNRTIYNIGNVEEIEKKNQSTVNAQPGRVPGGPAKTETVSPLRSVGSSDTSVAQSETAVNPHDTQNRTEYALNLNQFGDKRTRAADNLYDEIRKDMGQDAGINRRQVEEANRQYETRGAEDLVAELSTREMWTADDVAQAAVLRKRAENEGHLMQAAMMEQMYRERMTRAGAALQAGSIYKKLTASGAMAESLDRANTINRKRGLTDGMIPMGDSAPVMNWREQRQKAKTSLQYALMTDEQQQTAQDYERIIFKQAPESIYDLYEAAYETQKAAEKKLHVEQISRDNPWGLPIEDWKMELIDRYKLRGTKLPGYDYFKASKKERMLAAILATRSNERGHGLLTLCQQLEFMDAGYAVVTEADLNYITGEMATFQMLEEGNDEPQTPEGKTAIQRIYSAQANTMPNSLWGKWNNYGYDSMLSSPKTWNKNVMSNILTRPLELTSEKIAEFADKQIAKKTGNRTTAMPSREGRRAGNEAFAEEIANTLTDYLIRGTDTGHSSSFDLNNNRRTYDNLFMQTYHDFIAMAMQLGDRPFWEQCYAEEMRVLEELDTKAEELRRTEDGNEEVVLRKMNQKEREEEAARRATERVFQEDNVLINGINYVRGRSRAADLVIATLMPFLKTPTNVAIRAMQYSPMGLAYTVVKNGLIDSKTNNGLGFDQRKFVMNLGRGLTGTGLMVAGMAMANAGLIKPGREDEDDSRLSAIEKSSGKSYGMYFDVFGTEIPVDFAFPAVSPMIIGAEVAQTIAAHADSEDGVALGADVAKAMAAASLDQLCDNSMLQGVSSIFRGYKDNAQIVSAVLDGMAENTASRLTPASIRAVAKYTDPYVRDTKSQNGIRELLNAQIIQNWPILRQTLPKAQTLTGEDMLQTGANSWGKDQQNAALHFLNSFITPWTAGSETRDEKLDELVELAYSTGDTSFLPGTLVDGNKYSVTINKTLAKALKIGRVGVGQYESVTLHLTDEEKRWANSAYADALWNGSGRDVTGLRKLMDSRKWQRMNDEAKMTAVKEEAAKAKKAVLEEMVRRRK